MRRHEHELLLLCARRDVEQSRRLRPLVTTARRLTGCNIFVNLADSHGVCERLLPRLQAAAIVVPPTNPRNPPRRVARLSDTTSRGLAKRPILLQLLNTHGVRALTFKVRRSRSPYTVTSACALGRYRSSCASRRRVARASTAPRSWLHIARPATTSRRVACSTAYTARRVTMTRCSQSVAGLAAVDVHAAFASWVSASD